MILIPPLVRSLIETHYCRLYTADCSPVASLRSDPAVQDWVSHGVELHAGRDERCLFCRQDMPQERLEELCSHFLDVFTAHVELIGSLDTNLKTMGTELTD